MSSTIHGLPEQCLIGVEGLCGHGLDALGGLDGLHDSSDPDVLNDQGESQGLGYLDGSTGLDSLTDLGRADSLDGSDVLDLLQMTGDPQGLDGLDC